MILNPIIYIYFAKLFVQSYLGKHFIVETINCNHMCFMYYYVQFVLLIELNFMLQFWLVLF